MVKDVEIEKLNGADNYHTWQFAAKNLLVYRGLSNCIEDVKETDAAKLSSAKALLSLSVDKSIYVHIQKCTTANEIWQALKKLYDDKGLSRKVGLLKNLISTRLEDCQGMQCYVDKLLCSYNKLTGIGFDISDDWLTAILLAGLTENFGPFIMGIEATDKKLTSDVIISKLLDAKSSSNDGEAFVSKSFYKGKKNGKPKKKKKRGVTPVAVKSI